MQHALSPWHLVGLGSIGRLIASHLSLAGRPLVLLDPRLHAPHEHHWQLQHGSTEHTLTLTTQPTPSVPLDRLLITTKAGHCADALAPLLPYLHADSHIVLLHNGLGVREQLQARFGDLPGNWYQGITSVGANRPSADRLVYAGHGETVIGRADGQMPPALQQLAESLSVPALPVLAVSDILQRQWRKFAINCVINPLTAYYRCRNGEILQYPEQIDALCQEVTAIAQAVNQQRAVDGLAERVRQVATATADNTSSTLADILKGQATELDALTGVLLQLADQHGLSCPAHHALAEALGVPSR